MPRKSFLWLTLLMALLPAALFSQSTQFTLVSSATMDSLVSRHLTWVDSLIARQANDAGYTIMNDRDTKYLYYFGSRSAPSNEFVLFEKGSTVAAFCEVYTKVYRNGHTRSVLKYRMPSPGEQGEGMFIFGKIRRYDGLLESMELQSAKKRNILIYRKGGPLIIRTGSERKVYMPSLAD